MDNDPEPEMPGARLAFQPQKKCKADYEIGNIIGQGTFGQIRRVTDRQTGEVLAMKECNKRYLEQRDAGHFVMGERRALSRCNHHFIIKLHAAFQDDVSLYFVLDYMRNGSLRNLMQKYGILTIEMIRFYAIEILLGLEYLQSIAIVHRDIKGENILLDDNRHIKIADFGTCTVIADRQAYSRGAEPENNSMVGTAAYMAPEIVTRNQVTYGSDLWSVACLLYEMHTGHFCFNTHPPATLASRIVHVQHRPFPRGADPELVDMISRILVVQPKDRLGITERHRRMIGLKLHPFLMGINWSTIHHTEAPLPDLRTSMTPPSPPSVAFRDFDFNPSDRYPDSPPRPPHRASRAHSKSCVCKQATGSACICHMLPNYTELNEEWN